MDEQRDPKQLVAEGKRITQASEATAIGLLPAEAVASVDQSPTGVFLRCSKGYYWAGHVRASLESGAHGSDVLRSLARAASDRGFVVDRETLLEGGHFYTLASGEGVSLFAGLEENGTLLDIASFSPCIPLPDNYIPPETF